MNALDRIRFCIPSVFVFAGLLVVGVTPVAAQDAKVVKRSWFPRFSPDGTMVLSANGGWDKKDGGEARLFAVKDGAVQHTFAVPRGVRSVAWSPKGEFFVTGGYADGVRGFDVVSRKEVFQLAANKTVHNVWITSDGKLLAASFGNGIPVSLSMSCPANCCSARGMSLPKGP